MTWRTHSVVGANAVWLTTITGVDQWSIVFIVIGGFVALIPDIDATNARIHYMFGKIFSLFRGVFVHRGFFHSFLFSGILFIICFFF